MTAQDEQRIKEWLGELRLLVEGLQAQINSLRVEVVGLQKSQPVAAPAPAKKTKAEEAPTETK